MTYTPANVVTQQFGFEDFQFTYSITGLTLGTGYDGLPAPATDPTGMAVTVDNTGTQQAMKLVGTGDPIMGRIETFEVRSQENLVVGNVSRKFRSVLPTDGTTIVLGDEVVGGATAGTVKSNGTQPAEGLKTNRVLQILTGNRVVVEKL